MHNSMMIEQNDTSEIVNNVNNVDRCAMANEAIGLSRSMFSYYIENDYTMMVRQSVTPEIVDNK